MRVLRSARRSSGVPFRFHELLRLIRVRILGLQAVCVVLRDGAVAEPALDAHTEPQGFRRRPTHFHVALQEAPRRQVVLLVVLDLGKLKERLAEARPNLQRFSEVLLRARGVAPAAGTRAGIEVGDLARLVEEVAGSLQRELLAALEAILLTEEYRVIVLVLGILRI